MFSKHSENPVRHPEAFQDYEAFSEKGGFYRVVMGNERYWVAKDDVKHEVLGDKTQAFVISKEFKDNGKYLIYTFNLSGKTPYIIKENNDNDYKSGLALNFYNTLLKPIFSNEYHKIVWFLSGFFSFLQSKLL